MRWSCLLMDFLIDKCELRSLTYANYLMELVWATVFLCWILMLCAFFFVDVIMMKHNYRITSNNDAFNFS